MRFLGMLLITATRLPRDKLPVPNLNGLTAALVAITLAQLVATPIVRRPGTCITTIIRHLRARRYAASGYGSPHVNAIDRAQPCIVHATDSATSNASHESSLPVAAMRIAVVHSSLNRGRQRRQKRKTPPRHHSPKTYACHLSTVRCSSDPSKLRTHKTIRVSTHIPEIMRAAVALPIP